MFQKYITNAFLLDLLNDDEINNINKNKIPTNSIKNNKNNKWLLIKMSDNSHIKEFINIIKSYV